EVSQRGVPVEADEVRGQPSRPRLEYEARRRADAGRREEAGAARAAATETLPHETRRAPRRQVGTARATFAGGPAGRERSPGDRSPAGHLQTARRCVAEGRRRSRRFVFCLALSTAQQADVYDGRELFTADLPVGPKG